MAFSSTTNARGQTPTGNYDKFAFVKYMKDIGKSYQKQAMELVSLCRTFSQAQPQTPNSNARLRNALQIVDEALGSAAEARKKTSEKVDDAFKEAVKALKRYEEKYHHDCERKVGERMEAAKKRDINFQSIWDTISCAVKEVFSPKVTNTSRQPEREPTKVVEFHLHKSLPARSPIIMKQVLSRNSTIPEVLWNFSRFKKGENRLTLKQNPHFYKFRDIPSTAEGFNGRFTADPIAEDKDFQIQFQPEHAKICVITDSDKPGRIFLETAQHRRAFGNVWHIPDNNAIIFKDLCGKLEGEEIVHENIKGPSDLWHLEELPSSPTSSPPVVAPSPSNPSNTATPTTTSSASDDSFCDWREPIRKRFKSDERVITLEANNIYIRAAGFTGSSSPPSPLTPLAGSGANGSSGNGITNKVGTRMHLYFHVVRLRDGRPRRTPREEIRPVVASPSGVTANHHERHTGGGRLGTPQGAYMPWHV